MNVCERGERERERGRERKDQRGVYSSKSFVFNAFFLSFHRRRKWGGGWRRMGKGNQEGL